MSSWCDILSVGDLVIKKGFHEAKVHFIEGIGLDNKGETLDILLVDGKKDLFFSNEYDSPCDNTLDYFIDNYRLLARDCDLFKE